MALADFTRVKKRIIQLLGANNAAYLSTVDGNMGAFPYDQEIIDACLESDAMLVTESYFNHPTLSASFYTLSGNLADGAAIPSFVGSIGKVQLQNLLGQWEEGTAAQSKDDVVNLRRYGIAYLGATGVEGQYFLSKGGYIYHTSTFARIQYPVYAHTAALPSFDMHEQAVIAGALAMLYKFGSPFHSEPGAQFYTNFFEAQKQRIAFNQDLNDTPSMVGSGE